MEFYHILNRGVEKRDVVLNDDDRMRFVRSLYVLNDSNPPPSGRTQQKLWSDLSRKRDPLVHIHAWCLMNNHYHLLLSPVNDNLSSISKFMKKLNMGYAKFFNEKYDRSGYLWQGRYKKILIEQDSHFTHIPYYIHLNPLDYKFKEWRTGNIKNFEQVLKFLNEYRWSSFFDYTQKKNFPSVMYNRVLAETLGSANEQTKMIKQIITSSELTAPSVQLEA